MSEEAIKFLRLSDIRIDGDTQPRVEVQEEVVDAYRRDMRKGANFPPVEVVFDGIYYWLCDGFHRYKAARLAHRADLKAIVHTGTKDEAVWRCLAANAVHGLRRTNEDKLWAIGRAIKIRPDRSNRFLADHVGVDHKTVSRQRGELESTGEILQLPRLRGVDGRWRPAKVAYRRPAQRGGWPTGENPQLNDDQRLAGIFDNMPRPQGRRWDGRFNAAVRALPLTDCASNRLTEDGTRHLQEVFDRRERVLRFIKQARKLQEELMMSFDRHIPLFDGFDWKRCDRILDELLLHLRAVCPYAVCPRCKGAGCDVCNQRGWLSQETYGQAREGTLPEPVEVSDLALKDWDMAPWYTK
jgi:hypothetical protein